jgi:hypothetical protein
MNQNCINEEIKRILNLGVACTIQIRVFLFAFSPYKLKG